MTIAELISNLSQYDKNAKVQIYDYENNEPCEIYSIDELNKKVVIFYE